MNQEQELNFEEKILQMWEEHPLRQANPIKAEKEIYSEARARGWNLPKVMATLRKIRNPSRNVIQPQKKITESLFSGCQEDEEGNTLDPYTQQ